jgi:hypothetical protein
MNLKPSLPAFIDFLLAGWISCQQLVAIEYLKAENRMLRWQGNAENGSVTGNKTVRGMFTLVSMPRVLEL